MRDEIARRLAEGHHRAKLLNRQVPLRSDRATPAHRASRRCRVNLADERGERDDLAARQPSRTYYPVFELVESDLLRIAALLKHPSFQEEEEWRIVSPVITDYLRSPVLFREDASMLVPYFEFKLTAGSGESVPLEHLFLGPTLNINLSMDSLKLYLAKQGINPRQGISYCQIPYRQW